VTKSHEVDKPRTRGTATTLGLVGLALALFIAIREWLPLGELPPGTDADAIRSGLAILVFAAVLWLSEALPLAITALLVPVAATISGTLDVGAGFASFAHPLIFLFFGGFALAAALARHGVDRWIGRRAMVLGRGRFHPTALILFAIAGGMSMWISNTATAALLVPVAMGLRANVAQAEGEARAREITPYLLLGIAYSASIGSIGTILGTGPNAIAALQLGYGFVDWLKFGLPTALALLPTLWLLLRVICRPGAVGALATDGHDEKLSPQAWGTFGVFLVALVGWLLSRPLGQAVGVTKSFDTVVAMAAIGLLGAFRLVEWKHIERGTEWGVLLLFGGGLTLSKVLGETGASLYLAEGIHAATAGWALLPFLAVLVLFVIFLTELSSNTATTALLVPIFAAVAADMGVAEPKLVIPIAISASCAFMLPIATPPNAIVFASGMVTQRRMMRTGIFLNLAFAVILTLLGRYFF